MIVNNICIESIVRCLIKQGKYILSTNYLKIYGTPLSKHGLSLALFSLIVLLKNGPLPNFFVEGKSNEYR